MLDPKASIARIESRSKDGPHFRILATVNVELGAAWQKTFEHGNDYLSVKLDDPSFPNPIYAARVEVEGLEGLQLIWSRNKKN